MSTDRPRGLSRTDRTLLMLFVLIAVGVATGILADHTVGEALSPRSSGLIGFAVALLVVVTILCLYALWDPNRGPVLPLGLALIGCGTACVLMSVALQFYLAGVAGESARRAGDLVGERMRAGQSANVNVNANVPPSVPAVGVRVGLGRPPAAPPPLPRPAAAAAAADPLVGPV